MKTKGWSVGGRRLREPPFNAKVLVSTRAPSVNEGLVKEIGQEPEFLPVR